MTEVFDCPHCGFQLWRLDRSPMCDEWVFYCDHCPRRVEVSFYDTVVNVIQNQLRSKERSNDYKALIDKIEAQLKTCSCGGHYKLTVAKRCFNCNAEVIEKDDHGSMGRGIELYPGIFYVDEDDELDLAIEDQYVEFEEKFVRRENIWKPL